MFCTNCGKSNPDDFNFCYFCGKPRSAAAAGNSVSSQSTGEKSTKLKQAYNYLLERAGKAVRGEIRSPLSDLEPADLNILAILNTLSNEEITQFVSPLAQDESPQYFCFLDALMTYGEAADVPSLVQGAFWAKNFTIYSPDYLDQLVQDKDWQAYDKICSQYVDDARHTKSATCLVIPLFRAALAKKMLRDRAACRQYLDEFDRIIGQAYRESPAYMPGPFTKEAFEPVIRDFQNHANELRRQL